MVGDRCTNGRRVGQDGKPIVRTGRRSYSACFTTPDGAAFVNLSLLYQRQPGTVRIEGKLGLKECGFLPRIAETGKSLLPRVLPRSSETTLKKQRMESNRSSTLADGPRESDMPNHEAYKGANRDRQVPSGPLETSRFARASVMTHIKTIAGLCWIVLGGCGRALAQQPERAISTVPNLDYAYSNLPTQPVGPDDLLALSVYDSPELTRTVRVDANGNIRLPMLKDPSRWRAWFRRSWKPAIAKSLTNGKVLVDPIVTVTIVEYQSRPVNVVGAVKDPLVFQATRPIPLLDAIARAGGIGKTPARKLWSAGKSSRRETGQGHADHTGQETDRQCRSQPQRDAAWRRGSAGS